MAAVDDVLGKKLCGNCMVLAKAAEQMVIPQAGVMFIALLYILDSRLRG
jgi:hypothetical protein